ncbi:MAG: hypothetical protein F9K40_18815 [Kofleriaceae bacterium]|nr:MAG: hypothetical protein F9K40_18815 [Kofleriaceae bacterium]
MNLPVTRHQLAEAPAGPAVMRAGVVAWRHDGSLTVAGRGHARRVDTGFPDLHHHELSPDGRYLLALGDGARRAAVVDLRDGRLVLELVGEEERRHSLRVGFGVIGAHTYVFAGSRARRNAVSLYALDDGAARAWISAVGMIGFHVDRMIPLGPGWQAFLGHGDDRVVLLPVAVPTIEMLDDTEVLQTALREPRIKDWGYRVAIGPVSGGLVATFRDAGWDDDDRPDDPDEAFRGLAVRMPDSGAAVQRIAYAGEPLNGGELGGDDTHLAIQVATGIDVIERATGRVHRLDGAILDPHRMEVATVDGAAVTVEHVTRALARSAAR